MEFVLYKPNKAGTGFAVKFNVHKCGKYSFMQVAAQFAPMGSKNMFKWEDRETGINVKLGMNDLCAFHSVLSGRKESVKLFHKTDRDNKSIEFTDSPNRGGYGLGVSHQMSGEVNKAFIGIRYEECAQLVQFINGAIDSILRTNVYVSEE